jgi:predicted Rossmann-fold nucleotide-binding protein
MRVGVIGSRNFNDYILLKETLDNILSKKGISLIVSGGAKGADALSELWATQNNIKTLIFKPDWSIGKSAAAIRNQKIVENSDIIIAFWDGISKGTKMTIDMATSKNIKVSKVIYKIHKI